MKEQMSMVVDSADRDGNHLLVVADSRYVRPKPGLDFFGD